MKVSKVRLIQDPYVSFIYYKEHKPFTQWHHHPEYELCLITKGRGKRMVGNNIDRFEDNDLTFIGSYTPHEYLCDPEYFNHPKGFQGEGIVIQFVYDFLGDTFFKIPENNKLNRFILESTRGYAFSGKTRRILISIMRKMEDMDDIDRLHALLSIFRIFSSTEEFKFISTPPYNEPFWFDDSGPMQKAIKHLLQNFQNPVHVKDLLEITCMSNTAFYTAFKETYRMSFKDYLLNIRVGYACKLLTYRTFSISGVAYKSGFENISNFNRHFKKIKGITPSQFQEQNKNNENENVKLLEASFT